MSTEEDKKLPVKKSVARLAAVQYLFATLIDENALTPLKLLSLYQNNEIENDLNINIGYFNKLIEAITLNLTSQKLIIEDYLPKKKLEQQNLISQAIILTALCEYSFIENIPRKVLINEYTNIASSFLNNNDEIGFINAVLDKVLK